LIGVVSHLWRVEGSRRKPSLVTSQVDLSDVALIRLGESSTHALDLIERIVRAAACPVIAILETDDRDFINEAAKRGIFAYIADGEADQLQGSIDIVLRRSPSSRTWKARSHVARWARKGHPDGTPRRRRRRRFRDASHPLPQQ
jgi:AmiR/NasT family two-component response regulator